jgi:hypothetical protein
MYINLKVVKLQTIYHILYYINRLLSFIMYKLDLFFLYIIINYYLYIQLIFMIHT